MDISIDDAKQMLEAKLQPLSDEVARLESKLAIAIENRDRFHAALNALTGSAEKPKPKNEKPNIDANLLIQLMEQFLSDNGTIPLSDLESLVRGKAKELGYSLAGFGPCKKSALKSRQFKTDDRGYVSLISPTDKLSVA